MTAYVLLPRRPANIMAEFLARVYWLAIAATDDSCGIDLGEAGSRANVNAIEATELTKRFGDFCAVDHVTFSRGGRRTLRPAGAQRRRQDHADPHADHPDAAHRRHRREWPAMMCVKDPDGVRNSIGVIPQALTSDPELTAEENLSIHAKLYGVPADDARGADPQAARSRGSHALCESPGRHVFRRHAPAPGNRPRAGAFAEGSVPG